MFQNCLYSEVKEHLNLMNVSQLSAMNKWQFKRKVKTYIYELNKTQLLESSKKYKKLTFDELRSQTFERKSYFYNLSLDDARMRFRIASKTVPTIPANYPSKYRRSGRPLTCPTCSQSPTSSMDREEMVMPLLSQSHLLTECSAVAEFRDECNPSEDASLVRFFRRVVAKHMELEED